MCRKYNLELCIYLSCIPLSCWTHLLLLSAFLVYGFSVYKLWHLQIVLLFHFQLSSFSCLIFLLEPLIQCWIEWQGWTSWFVSDLRWKASTFSSLSTMLAEGFSEISFTWLTKFPFIPILLCFCHEKLLRFCQMFFEIIMYVLFFYPIDINYWMLNNIVFQG